MKTLTVELDNETSSFIKTDSKVINIKTLLNAFGVDLDFLVKEKKYQADYKQDIVSADFKSTNTF